MFIYSERRHDCKEEGRFDIGLWRKGKSGLLCQRKQSLGEFF